MSKECHHPTCEETCRRIKKPKKIYAIKRTPIRKVSKKQSKIVKDRKTETEKDWRFYLEIWEERDHVDFETGDSIIGEPLTLYFHHILSKGVKRFKQFRRCTWNVVIISWMTHTNADNAMTNTPRIKSYYNYLIKHLDQIKKGIYKPTFEKWKKEK